MKHMITTEAEYNRALASLERRPARELAEYILSLAQATNGIGRYIHAFALADDPVASCKVLEHELAILRHGRSDYAARHQRGFDFSDRAERFLDAVETFVGPANRDCGLSLLIRFVDGRDDILGNCHEDDDAGRHFTRAERLLDSLQGGA